MTVEAPPDEATLPTVREIEEMLHKALESVRELDEHLEHTFGYNHNNATMVLR